MPHFRIYRLSLLAFALAIFPRCLIGGDFLEAALREGEKAFFVRLDSEAQALAEKTGCSLSPYGELALVGKGPAYFILQRVIQDALTLPESAKAEFDRYVSFAWRLEVPFFFRPSGPTIAYYSSSDGVGLVRPQYVTPGTVAHELQHALFYKETARAISVNLGKNARLPFLLLSKDGYPHTVDWLHDRTFYLNVLDEWEAQEVGLRVEGRPHSSNDIREKLELGYVPTFGVEAIHGFVEHWAGLDKERSDPWKLVDLLNNREIEDLESLSLKGLHSGSRALQFDAATMITRDLSASDLDRSTLPKREELLRKLRKESPFPGVQAVANEGLRKVLQLQEKISERLPDVQHIAEKANALDGKLFQRFSNHGLSEGLKRFLVFWASTPEKDLNRAVKQYEFKVSPYDLNTADLKLAAEIAATKGTSIEEKTILYLRALRQMPIEELWQRLLDRPNSAIEAALSKRSIEIAGQLFFQGLDRWLALTDPNDLPEFSATMKRAMDRHLGHLGLKPPELDTYLESKLKAPTLTSHATRILWNLMSAFPPTLLPKTLAAMKQAVVVPWLDRSSQDVVFRALIERGFGRSLDWTNAFIPRAKSSELSSASQEMKIIITSFLGATLNSYHFRAEDPKELARKRVTWPAPLKRAYELGAELLDALLSDSDPKVVRAAADTLMVEPYYRKLLGAKLFAIRADTSPARAEQIRWLQRAANESAFGAGPSARPDCPFQFLRNKSR